MYHWLNKPQRWTWVFPDDNNIHGFRKILPGHEVAGKPALQLSNGHVTINYSFSSFGKKKCSYLILTKKQPQPLSSGVCSNCSGCEWEASCNMQKKKKKFTTPSYLIKKAIICLHFEELSICTNSAASLSSQLVCLVAEDTHESFSLRIYAFWCKLKVIWGGNMLVEALQ